jgi:hypothetical protein
VRHFAGFRFSRRGRRGIAGIPRVVTDEIRLLESAAAVLVSGRRRRALARSAAATTPTATSTATPSACAAFPSLTAVRAQIGRLRYDRSSRRGHLVVRHTGCLR